MVHCKVLCPKYSYLPHGEGDSTGLSRCEGLIKAQISREKSYITGISIDEGGRGMGV